LYTSPERFRMAPAAAPATHAAAAERIVTLLARTVPRRSPACTSARHALASARVANVFVSRRRSRALHTTARYVGEHEHRPPPPFDRHAF